MTQALHIQLLGEFQMLRSEVIPLRSEAISLSPLEQTLLAYLLLHRDAPQSRQQIAFHFWPDSSDAQARGQLRKLYYRMRRHLPDPELYLQAETQTVQWRPEGPYTLDVAEFDRILDEVDEELDTAEHGLSAQARVQVCRTIEAAVDLYGGDLLPNCYEDWIAPERLRLSQRFVHALEQLIALQEQAREYERAIEAAERLLRYDPLHEPCYRALMRLYALTGDRARALRIYHTCTTVLERELGVEPGPSTQALYQRLMQAEPLALPSAEPEMPIRAVAGSQPGAAGLAAVTTLVGRHQEWDWLGMAWRTACQGAPRVALIQGEAGIGKTRLAEELVQWVQRQGGTTLTANCYQAEGALAYAPVVQWLRAHDLPPLEAVWRSELARLLPELLGTPGLQPPGPMTESWQRQRFFQALAHAFVGAPSSAQAQCPLLLLLDDVQWCDAETLEWLHYLLRHDPRAPLLVLCTLRLEETDQAHPLTSWLQALRRTDQVVEWTLGPLSEDETHALATQVTQAELDPALAACIHDETEGNPLFVVELARAGRLVAGSEPECPPQGLPPRVQSTIEHRLAQLSLPAREVAGLAATIGREFSFGVLAQASTLEPDALLRALDELWQRRVVREAAGDSYDFAHDKLRQVAYARLSAARQRDLHDHVARALEAVYAADLDAVAARMAAHCEQAGQLQRALEFYLRAAQTASQVYANHQAAAYYERVLALVSQAARQDQAEWRFQALGGLGEINLRLGQPAQADKRLSQALALGRSLSAPPLQLARLYYARGRVLYLLRRFEEMVRIGQEGLQVLDLPPESDPEPTAGGSPEAALLLSMIATGYDQSGSRVQARAIWSRVAAMIETLDYCPELDSVYSRVAVRYMREKNLEAVQRWLQLVEEQTVSAQDERGAERRYERRTMIAAQLGDLQSALVHQKQGLDYATRVSNLSQAHVHTFLGGFYGLAQGDLDHAESMGNQLLDLEASMAVVYHTVWGLWLRGLVLLCRGQRREGVAVLSQMADLTRDTDFVEVEAWAERMQGQALLDQGEREAALRHYRRAAAAYTPEMLSNWRAREMRAYAFAFVDLLYGLEGAFSNPAAFGAYCAQFPGRAKLVNGAAHSPDLAQLALKQWALEPATPAPIEQDIEQALLPELLYPSEEGVLPAGWAWTDPFGDCRFTRQSALTIEAANGRDLWLLNRSAPRLLVSLDALCSGPFSGLTVETLCAPFSADRPAMGGLLLWIDAAHYVRLDRGLSGPNAITLIACVEDQDAVLGRGRLPPAGTAKPGRLYRAWLRFEWTAGTVRALCSADGETWYSVGQVRLPLNPNAQIGLYASGNIDRTVYHGAYSEGAALRFEALRCWID